MESPPNKLTGAEALVHLLEGHGVSHIFGLCGDTSLPFYDALARLPHGITHILTRDERHAGYMADAYARVTGKPGICEGPSGGGATYILPALVEANESSVPIVAITTDVATTSAGRFPLTELDQGALFRPVTKWNAVIPSVDLLPRLVRRAFREATSGRPGSVHLGLPFDVQKADLSEPDTNANGSFASFPALPATADAEIVKAIIDRLMRSARPVLIAGGGIVLADGTDALLEFAETTGVPVATSVSGQGTLPETHPLAIGVVGSNGGQPATRSIIDDADLVIFVGCRAGSVTTERWRSPARGTPVIHIDSDPAVMGASYHTEIELVADARLAMVALAKEARERAGWTSAGAARVAEVQANKWRKFDLLSTSDEVPIRPERVIASLQAELPDDAVICADPGTPCPYFSAWYRWPKSGRHFITNRAHGALGYALAASIGAQIGRPNATVVCATGDGSFAMSVGELETVQRLGLPIKILVFSNAVFGWIKAGQKSGFGERYFSVDFSRTDHAAVASAYGIWSRKVEDPRELQNTFRAAVHHDGPCLIDVVSQPLQDADAPVSEWIA